MKLLITQRDLIALGGSELFTIEMAMAMRARGHEVRVYAPGGGEGMLRLQSIGIHVHQHMDDLPWVPDLIHGQHHLQTMTALTRFPETGAVSHMHGGIPWVEQPPRHGNIRRHIVTCAAMAQGMETYYGIPPSRVRIVPNYVDLDRFQRVRQPRSRPERALVFGNHRYPGDQLRMLADACSEAGIRLDSTGAHLGERTLCPESMLADYDLVFAIGRCALEALASGCAVIPVCPGFAGSLVTTDNLPRMIGANFSPRRYSPEAALTPDWLRSQIAACQPDETAAVTAIVRRECGMTAAMDQLESIHREAAAEHAAGPALPPAEFIGDLYGYLAWIGPETDKLWAEAWEVRKAQMALEETASLRDQLERHRQNLDRVETELKKLQSRLEKSNAARQSAEKRWRAAEQYLKKNPLRRYFWNRILSKIPPDSPDAKT